MKTRPLLTLALLLTTFQVAQAQDEQPATVAKSLFKINFLAPGLEYERGLNESMTLNINTSMGFEIGYNSITGLNTYLYPSLGLQARKYYNLDKRIEKGKNTAFNSGNFIALSAFGSTPSILNNENRVNEASYGIGPVWGMQRNYKSGFNLTLALGAGYTKNHFGESKVAPLAGLNLGFLIGRR
jgi:hypothetical protein